MSDHGLTDEQRAVLAAAAERIVPSDDGPGGAETGAAAYVERLLGTDRFRGWAPLFAEGLGRLQELAGEIWGRPFPACSPEERDAVLGRFQEQPDRLHRAFFRQLVVFTLEGFLRNDLGSGYLGAPEVHVGHCLGKPVR